MGRAKTVNAVDWFDKNRMVEFISRECPLIARLPLHPMPHMDWDWVKG
jgi:hypothetical protein